MPSNNNQNFTYTASSSFSVSSSSNGQTRSYSETRQTNPSGTQVHRTSQEPGEARKEEHIQYDACGHRIGDNSGRSRIEDVTEAEREKDEEREYVQRMEEEYAKREGGA